MEASSKYVKHQWVELFAVLIFFFNSFLLPGGFTIVLLLAPVWIYFLYLQNRLQNTFVFCLPLLLYAIIHFIQGVELPYYFISVTILAVLIFFTSCIYYFVNSTSVNWGEIFRHIAILNFIFVLASLPLLYIPVLKPIVWYLKPISPNVPIIPRLKLFVEEASHYSYWMAPVAIYFYSVVLFFKPTKPYFTLFIITLPLIFSFALGALSVLLLSFLIILIFYSKQIFNSKKVKIAIATIAIVLPLAFVIFYFLFPGNVLFQRLHNIVNGNDTSIRGRTYESFILANKIAGEKSYWWGIGPGQLKLLGKDIILQYYKYINIPVVVRIPNACAETLVYFGYIGLVFRLAIQFFLFFKTKVFLNPYRFWLFLFVFLYQFAGSYITNVTEYIIYLFVFSPVFPEFEKVKEIAISKKVSSLAST